MVLWEPQSRRILVGISFLWLALVGLLFRFYPYYRVVGPALVAQDFNGASLPEAQQIDGAPRLQAHPTESGNYLVLEGARTSMRWKIPFSGGQSHLRVRCRLASRAIVMGDEIYQCGLLSVYLMDNSGNSLGSLPNFGFLEGDNSWRDVRGILLSNHEVEEVYLNVYNLGRSGALLVDDLFLEPVKLGWDAYLLWFFVLSSMAWIGYHWIRRLEITARFIGWMFPLLCCVIVFFSICSREQMISVSKMLNEKTADVMVWVEKMRAEPESVTGETVAPVPVSVEAEAEADKVVEPPPQKSERVDAPKVIEKVAAEPGLLERAAGKFKALPTSKKGHVLLFSLLALVGTIWCGGSGVNILGEKRFELILVLGLLALSTEVLQLQVVGRTAHINDFLLDMSGVVGGWLLGVPMAYVVKRIQGFLSKK